MDQRARAGDAGLAGRRENAGDHALHRFIEIGIVENDVRRLPAELERDVLDAFRAQAVDVLARAVAAGEGDLGDVAMRDQRLAHFVAESGDDVDDSRRESGPLE